MADFDAPKTGGVWELFFMDAAYHNNPTGQVYEITDQEDEITDFDACGIESIRNRMLVAQSSSGIN